MTHADKKNPIHFGSDPANIRIRIQINPEIRIRIPDRILVLAEFALSGCSCLIIFALYIVLTRQTCAALVFYMDRMTPVDADDADSDTQVNSSTFNPLTTSWLVLGAFDVNL